MTNKVSWIIQFKDRASRTAAKVKRGFKGADAQAKKLNRTVKGMKSPFSALKDETRDLVRNLGMVAAITATVTVGGAYQDSLAELSAITGATGSSLQTMSRDAQVLAKRFNTDQSLVAKAITQTASAKSELLKDPKALTRVTAEALRLSKAAGIGIPEAVRASIGALNQWGAGADQAGKFVNVIAAGAKVGASEVFDTAEALKNAGSVAAQFNVTFEETNSLIQVLAKNGVKGAEAGTALRGTLSKLEKFAGGKFSASKLGIINSLEAIEKLGLSNSEVIKEFGEENLRSILILRKNVPLIKQWTRELTGTNVATEQANVRMDTFNQRMIKAGISMKGLAIKVFNGWEPVLSKLITWFTAFLNLIDGVLSSLGELIGQFAGAVFSLDFGHFDFGAVASRFMDAFGTDSSESKSSSGRGSRTPSTSAQGGNGNVSGKIVVEAAPGTVVRETQMKSTSGGGLNVGLNMVTQ